jgi:hypothetical protein
LDLACTCDTALFLIIDCSNRLRSSFNLPYSRRITNFDSRFCRSAKTYFIIVFLSLCASFNFNDNICDIYCGTHSFPLG